MIRSSRTGEVFKAPKSKLEAKADATTRAVREIIAKETAATEAKTKRLREARLAREADERAAAKDNKPT